MLAIRAFSWVLAAAFAAPQEPLPLDLAFSARSLSVYERPALSPDGRFVAYAVHTPPPQGGDRGLLEESRYFPTGTPVTAQGVRLWVAECATGSARAVGPEGASSIRPSWSPDGRRLAFYCDAGGSMGLWIYDAAAGTARRAGDAKIRAHLWSGDEPQWTSDGKEVLLGLLPPAGEKPKNPASGTAAAPAAGPRVEETSRDRWSEGSPGPGEEFFARENACSLAFVNVDSGAARVVVPHTAKPTPSAARLAPSGKRLAYGSVYRPKGAKAVGVAQDLVVCDARTGDVEYTETGLEVADDPAAKLFRWHPKDDRIVFLRERRVVDVDFAAPFPIAGGQRAPRQLAHNLGEVDPRLVAFTRDGGSLVIGLKMPEPADDPRLGTRNLAIVPLNGDPLVTLSVPTNWRMRDLLLSRPDVLWQPNPGEIRAFGRDLSSGEPALLAIELATGATSPLRRGRFSWSGVGATPDQASFLANYQDAGTPPDLRLFSADLQKSTPVTRVEPRFAEISLGSAQSFATQVVGHDGKPRTAFTTAVLPPGAKAGDRFPAVCFVYGGARLSAFGERFGGGDVVTIPVSVFTTRGYVALLPDCLMGPEGSKGNPVQELRDALIPQILHAGELGIVDLEKVAVVGQSYGGYGVAGLLSSCQLFRAGIAISGLYDLPGLFAWRDARGTGFHARWSEGGQGRMGGTPWEELPRYLENSPYYRADKIRTPLLMIHGEADDTCPVADAQKMFNALDRLGSKAQLAVYPGEGHVISEWSRADATDAAERVLRFLGKYLKGS